MKKDKYTSRLIAPMQSIGRCGKSTLMQLFAQYLKDSEVDTTAIDCDPEHATLSSWYPGIALHPFRVEGDLLPILNHCGSAKVELIDFPAQATEEILSAFRKFQAKKIFEEKNIGVTIPIFASDERIAMLSAAKIISETKDFADFVIVKNPARFTSETFDSSKIATEMLKGCPEITIPAIIEETIREIDQKSKEAKKSLTFTEVLEKLPIASRMEVEHFVNSVFAQFNDIKSLIVPDVALITNKTKKASVAAATSIDPYDL